jgi:hypothetical protein
MKTNEGRNTMYIDELPIDQQDTTTHCYSCGAVRSPEELGECTRCGDPICGLADSDCPSTCSCDDKLRELIPDAKRRALLEEINDLIDDLRLANRQLAKRQAA